MNTLLLCVLFVTFERITNIVYIKIKFNKNREDRAILLDLSDTLYTTESIAKSSVIIH